MAENEFEEVTPTEPEAEPEAVEEIEEVAAEAEAEAEEAMAEAEEAEEAVEAVETEAEEAVAEEPEEAAETAEEEAAEAEEAAQTDISATAQEVAEVGKHSAPKEKGKKGNIIHWVIHIILVIIIACLCWLCFSPTGKLVQSYGISETMQGKSSYSGSQWEEAGYTLEDYMYYYDMYAESFEQYKDQYKAMGMESVDDLMNSLFQMLQGTYTPDAAATDGGGEGSGDQAQEGQGQQ